MKAPGAGQAQAAITIMVADPIDPVRMKEACDIINGEKRQADMAMAACCLAAALVRKLAEDAGEDPVVYWQTLALRISAHIEPA